MDVALGPTDVPFSRWIVGFLALLILEVPAFAALGDEGAIHASGDKEIWNRNTNKVELIGHAAVRQVGESLTADYIILDQNTHMLDAHGNCIYIAYDSVIFGDEMHFNLDTRTGSIVNGRVSTDRFTLAGERINKLGPSRFQTHWGEYSTCKDCPEAWAVQAKDVDLEVEGYAYMSDVTMKLKDNPAVWLPYLVLPIKSQRQTGFLFPTYSTSDQNGLAFVLPFFWAINRSADMTIGLGDYSAKGPRVEWEGRYVLAPRSKGQANFNFINDSSYSNPSIAYRNPSLRTARWGLEVGQTQDFGDGWEEKLKLLEVSDNAYPFYFPNDLSEKNEAFLSSIASVGYSSSAIDGSVAVKRYRNLLSLEQDSRVFDPTTVQAYPMVDLTTLDRPLLGTPVIGDLSLGLANFSRTAGPFDTDVLSPTNPLTPEGVFVPGKDPLREATRASFSTTVYTTVQPVEGFSLVPSLSYYDYFYSFHGVAGVPSLTQSYLLAQLDVVTQLERIYDTDNPDVPRRKHIIRPILTYDYIPYVHQDGTHPFIQQINYAKGQGYFGYNFDDADIIPRDTSPSNLLYFTPLGNSITYGVKTQLIDRIGPVESENASYRTPFEFDAGQTFNLREFQIHSGNAQPFSRLYATAITNYLDRFVTNSTYYYYPYSPVIHNTLSSSVTYILDRSLHQRVLTFDRSITFNYTWNQITLPTSEGTHDANVTLNYSLSDYILPSAGLDWDFVNHRLNTWAFGIQFQSPSQCWKISMGVSGSLTNHSFSPPALSLNLTGNGFEGVQQMTTGTAVPGT